MQNPGYIKIIEYIKEIFQHRLKSGDLSTPIIIGISGPQGSGKSYGSERASKALGEIDSRFVTYPLSMDDVYLTHKKQLELTEYAKVSLNDNRLLQGRGLPGTHDLTLLKEVFRKVKNKEPVQMPMYDKSLYAGEGDQLEMSQWPLLNGTGGNLAVLLVEGWFTGYKPLDETAIKSAFDNAPEASTLKKYKLQDLLEVNKRLADYGEIWEEFDYFVNIETADVNNVFEWRIQQEHDLIKKKGTGMTDDEVRNFISRYMVLYELYYKNLCQEGCAKKGCNLNVEIDKERELVSARRS